MNLWQIIALVGAGAGAGAGAAPVSSAQDRAQPAPPTRQTTWHCVATSHTAVGQIEAEIEVDIDGKPGGGDLSWQGEVGDGVSVKLSMRSTFSRETPDALDIYMLLLDPDVSDEQTRDALRADKFQWTISTHLESQEAMPAPLRSVTAFAGKFEKFGLNNFIDPDPDDFLSMVRGSDKLYLIARNEKGAILAHRTLAFGKLNAGMAEARKRARQAADLSTDPVKSCERDDHNPADMDIVV
ncbi:MAG: hypothetical protein ABIS51_00775 [Sphingomonas sp.]